MDNKLSPPPVISKTLMSFPDALRKLIQGKKIYRTSWNTQESYGLLLEGQLMIFINGGFKQWLVNDGDLLAQDWTILE